MMLNPYRFAALLAAAAFTLSPCQLTWSAENTESATDKERKLIAALRSDAPLPDKAITCKQLAIYGSKEAVPALAELLPNADLSSWARIALEAIPDPSALQALRAAIPKVEGRLLVGVINSIGARQDKQSVEPLTEKLKAADPQVAMAAAEALGQIGGQQAAKALEAALTTSQGDVQSAVAYGSIVCAEKLLAGGNASAAAALCDKVRQSNVPKQRILEATRGAILARKSDGVSLLLEQLRSADIGLFGIGVRTARELPGREVTQAVAAELDKANPDRQIALLLALADRTDAAVLPKVLQVAESGQLELRKAALGLLDRYNDLACVPVLLAAAAENDAELARTAKSSLTRLGGKEIDADLLARLRLASGKTRQVLIELAGLRRIEAAIPIAMRSTEDADTGVRRAAVETVGLLGTEKQAGGLVRLLASSNNESEREELERALTAICRRNGARCLPDVLPLAKTGDSEDRNAGLRVLSSIGGAEALNVVKAAANDADSTVQDEAVNLLSTWPNTWPEDTAVAEPLLALVKSSKKPSHQVQGLRGYMQHIEENKKLSNEEKISEIKGLLEFAPRPDQKRQVISVVGTIPTPAALDLLMTLAKDEVVAEEAYLAASKIAADRKLKNIEQRREALRTIAAQSQNETTKKKAAEELEKLP